MESAIIDRLSLNKERRQLSKRRNMSNIDTTQLKAMGASYGRSVLGAGLALYMSGVTDPKDLWAALVAALAPVALRAINPSDQAFGILPTVESVDKALKAVKAPAKKAAKKAPAKKK
jgi:hypothetical protein